MDYLHFIGKQYYKRHQFISEARRYGVNRRIAPNVFRKMRMGDRVFLAQGDQRGSQIFGYFVFTRIKDKTHKLDRLTPRELQTLTLVAEGKPYGEIAEELDVSYKTVANICTQLKSKLGARTRPELMRIAIQHLPENGNLDSIIREPGRGEDTFDDL